MRVVYEKPPIWEKARRVFGPAVEKAIFAWGDVIYYPSGGRIPDQLIAHEEIHGNRQKEFGNLEIWWDHYLNDKSFRLSEEIPAHITEYQYYVDNCAVDRNDRRLYLKLVAQRLSGPFYGHLITFDKAIKLLKNGCEKRCTKDKLLSV